MSPARTRPPRRPLSGAAPVALALLAAACGGNNPSRPTVTVAIEPRTVPSLPVGGTQAFAAEASGAGDRSVAWSVREPGADAWLGARGPATASFTPLAPGTFHVVATSVALASAYAEATVTVPEPPAASAAVAVAPWASVLLPRPAPQGPGGPAWRVLEPDGGSIDQDGRYTAPGREGVYRVADGAFVVEVTVRAGLG